MRGQRLTKEIVGKLKSSLEKKTKRIIALNLRDYYNNNLRISGVINYYLTEKDSSLVDIWSNEEIKSFRVTGSFEDLEKKFLEEQKLSEEFESKTKIDIFDFFPMNKARNILLAKELKQALIDDGYFDSVKEKQKLASDRTTKWLLTLAHAGSFSNFDVKFWDETKEIYYMPWPVVLDSYVRDFELYFKYIIRPVLYEDNEKFKSYHDDLEEFFMEDKQLLSSIRKEFMKPWLRNKLVHNQYYIIPKENKIRFFDHEDDDEETEKEISFSDFSYMLGELNVFLWMSITVIYKIQRIELSPIMRELVGPYFDFFITKEQYIPELKSLEVFTDKVLVKTLEEINYNLTKPIYESIHFLKILSEKIDGEYSIITWMFQKVMFLIAYSIMISKYVHPIATTLKPNLHKFASDEEMLNVIAKYRDGKFYYLFKWVDVELRNVLAHYSYDIDENSKAYYINRKGEETEIILGLINGNQIIINELDPIFDPDITGDEFDSKVVKAFVHVFYKQEKFEKPEFYIELGNELMRKKKYQIIGIILLIIAGFLFVANKDSKNAKRILEKASKESNQILDSELDMIWSWVFNRYDIFLQSSQKEGLDLFFKEFRNYPIDKFTILFKIIYLYERGERNKANEFYTKMIS